MDGQSQRLDVLKFSIEMQKIRDHTKKRELIEGVATGDHVIVETCDNKTKDTIIFEKNHDTDINVNVKSKDRQIVKVVDNYTEKQTCSVDEKKEQHDQCIVK